MKQDSNIGIKYARDTMPGIYYRKDSSDITFLNGLEKPLPTLDWDKSVKNVYIVGAHIGCLTLMMAELYPNAILHCFEPDPDNFELLNKNTAHLKDRTVLNKVALGGSNGTVALYRPEAENDFSLYSTQFSWGRPPKTFVPQVRLDYYMDKAGVPEVFYISAVGAEASIFGSLDDTHLVKISKIIGTMWDLEAVTLFKRLNDLYFMLTFEKNFLDSCWPFGAANKRVFT